MSSDRKKAAPGVGSTEGSGGQIYFEGFDPSEDDFTIPAAPVQVGIERYLLHGQENALTMDQLRHLTGGLHSRKIRQAVQDARRRGVPVLSTSCPGGYFIAATEAEKQRFILSMTHRLRETAETVRCLRRAPVEKNSDERDTEQ